MDKVAVIILNWNGKDLLDKFLPPLLAYTSLPDCSLIVADNNSSDNSVAFVKEYFPLIKVLKFDENYGFAGGYNLAVEQTEAEYVVLLNSDVEVSENWLSPLIDVLDKNEKIAGLMPKIKSYKDKSCFEYAGAAGGYIDKLGYTFCKGRLFEEVEKDNGQYNKSSSVFWASGACLVVRKKLYIESGGLDEDFFAHMEEIDLCWRLKNRGYEMHYVAESKVYHIGGATLTQSNPKKTYLNFRNNLFLLYKNLPQKGLYSTLFKRLLLDGIAAGKFLLSFDIDNFFAVFDAHVSFYSSINKFKKKRKENLSHAVKFDHAEIYNRSIIIDYFFHKKTKYTDLKF